MEDSQGKKRSSSSVKTSRPSAHQPTTPSRHSSKPHSSSAHSNEHQHHHHHDLGPSTSPPRGKKHATPTSDSKSTISRRIIHEPDSETPRAGSKKRIDVQSQATPSEQNNAHTTDLKAHPHHHQHQHHYLNSPPRSATKTQPSTGTTSRLLPTNSYFSKLGNHHHHRRKPLPLCPSRKRVQGTRGNGAIQFFIDADTPGGHNFPSLVLVRGIEMYDSDAEDQQRPNAHHGRLNAEQKIANRSKLLGRSSPRLQSQRPPTPPKPSHKRPSRNRGAGDTGDLPNATADSSPEPTKRQLNNTPPDKPQKHSLSPSKQLEAPLAQLNNSALLQQLWHQTRLAQNHDDDNNNLGDRTAPVPRDSGTLAETLENSVGSASWMRRPDTEADDDAQSNHTFEQSPTRQQWKTPPAALQQLQHDVANELSDDDDEEEYEIDDVVSEEEEEEEEVEVDNDDDDDDDDDETSESDDADDHVKGYIHNYVQTQFHARLARTPSSSSSRENLAPQEEEISIDPLADFAPRQDELSVQDSLADIQDSFAVASMDDYSAPSVDYGYNEDIEVEQTASAGSISAKELEPVTLNPVLVSPVPSISSDGKPSAALRRPTHAEPPKSAMRKAAPGESGSHLSPLRRPTHAQIHTLSSSPSLRRPTHAEAAIKQYASSASPKSAAAEGGNPSPRTFRGSKKPASRVRQPSMIDPKYEVNASVPAMSRTANGRNHGSVSSGPLHHSHTSMGSSESDSSAAFQAANPYAMPESALDQSMAFMQFDFRAEAGVMRCETNEDVQVAESSDDEDSIDEFDASMLHSQKQVKGHDGAGAEMPDLEPLKKSDVSYTQRAPPRLPVRNKTNEDMPPQVPSTQRGLRGLVRNFSNRDALAPDSTEQAGAGRGALIRSLSTDGNILSPKRGLMRNFSNRAGRSASSERTEESKRQGLFRAPKLAGDKDATKDIMKKFFAFGNASSASLSLGNRLDGSHEEWMEDEVSLLLDT